jgi:hypothetical protein
MVSVAEFMTAAPAPLNGNSPWAARYAVELRRVITEYANNRPRNLQKHLGPSELGSPCDRQVAGKMAGLPATNHVVDPWPSFVGTALHAEEAKAFEWDNTQTGLLRWVAEQRVTPHPDHPGTGDLYDGLEEAVVDHKNLGLTSMAKVRSSDGPPLRYQIQLLLYGKGFRLMGLPVKRVVLAAYPRAAATLDGMFVWERLARPDDDLLLEEVFKLTAARQVMANQILSGQLTLNDIPKRADDDECYFCPFYRPQSARDNGPGCPGTTT